MTLFHACPSEIVRKVVTLLWGPDTATVDAEYGRRLFDDVRSLGLLDVESSGRVEMMRAGSPLCTHLRLSIAKSAPRAVASGAVTAEEVEEALATLNDATFATMSAITKAVWGRRPLGASEGKR